jgi:hypothetical protein
MQDGDWMNPGQSHTGTSLAAAYRMERDKIKERYDELMKLIAHLK